MNILKNLYIMYDTEYAVEYSPEDSLGIVAYG